MIVAHKEIKFGVVGSGLVVTIYLKTSILNRQTNKQRKRRLKIFHNIQF
jgi:hypothetical protein